MENYEEKNKIEITLKTFLEMREEQENYKRKVEMLKVELFKGFECNSKNEIVFERYNLKASIIHNLIKEIFPKDYELMKKTYFSKNSDDEDE